MQRRAFLQLSAVASLGVLGNDLHAEDSPPASQPASSPVLWDGRVQIYEIRTYHFGSAEKRDAFEKFAGEAMIPALNRLGIQPVGLFTLIDQKSPEATDLWLFLPHESVDSVMALEPRLAADEAYQSAGKDILLAGKKNPAFTRFDAQLLYAFASHPRLTPPPASPDRVFELRQYENPNQERALNKMKMFNSGEIPIFIRAGMPGVFFGEAFAGRDLPHLTYMVFHESQEASKKNWAAFGGDPDWHKLNTDPDYKDNVSKIVSRFLRPSLGSQI
jgi:hypothetical protein